MMKIGITERGDAGLDFSWTMKLEKFNIIISKNLNNQLIENLIEFRDKIIFHHTITGWGKSILEPNVPLLHESYDRFLQLINDGFNIKQYVLRIDPIIPTKDGLEKAKLVLEQFKDSGVKRVRFSFFDMYPHVKERFIQNDVMLPYETFHAPQELIENGLKLIEQYEDVYSFESCGEALKYRAGCISKKDLQIMGINEELIGASYQRPLCLCPRNKTELLDSRKQCAHKCLYCFWKREDNKNTEKFFEI